MTGMATFSQDDVCNFVREILSARSHEPLEITARPERVVRNDLAVEELWDGRLVSEAVQKVLYERSDAPDIVLLVETAGAPMYGWVLKDGPHFGDSVPMPTADRCYTQGQVARTW